MTRRPHTLLAASVCRDFATRECAMTLKYGFSGLVAVTLCLVPTRGEAAGLTGHRTSSATAGDFDGDGVDRHCVWSSHANSYVGLLVVVFGDGRIQHWNRNTPGVIGVDATYDYLGDGSGGGLR